MTQCSRQSLTRRAPRRPYLFLVACLLLGLLAPLSLGTSHPLPDLLVVDLEIGNGMAGHDAVVTLRNDGPGDAPGGTFTIGSDQEGFVHTASFEALSSGATTTVRVAWEKGLYGAHTFTIVVDPNGTLAETDEENNVFAANFDLPRAEVSLVHLEVPDGPWTQDAPIEVRAQVKNNGPAVAYGLTFSGVDDRNRFWTDTWTRLDPNFGKTATIGWWYPRADDATLRIQVDPDDLLQQADRSDDTRTITRAIEAPTPLEVSTSTFQSSIYSVSDGIDRYGVAFYAVLNGDHVTPETKVVLRDGENILQEWDLASRYLYGLQTGGDPAVHWNVQDGGYRQVVSLEHTQEVHDGHLPRYTLTLLADPGRPWELEQTFVDPAPPPVRSATGFRSWEMHDVLEGEDFARPDPACSPDADGEQTRFETEGDVTFLVLPRSGCGAGFGHAVYNDWANTSIWFPTARTFDSLRIRIDGDGSVHEGTVQVFIDGHQRASGTYALRPSDGFVTVPLSSETVGSGHHTVRLAFMTTRGPAMSDLHLDRIRSSASDPAPPQDVNSSPPPSPSPGPTYAPAPHPTPYGMQMRPDPLLEVGPAGLDQVSGDVRVNANATFAIEIANPHDDPVPVLVRWSMERPFDGKTTFAEETVTVPPGRTNVTVAVPFTAEHVDAMALVVTLLEPGTPSSQLYPPSVFHAELRYPFALEPPREHLEVATALTERRGAFDEARFEIDVRANGMDAPMTHVVVLDDGGHFVRVEGFPTDIRAGDTHTFVVIVDTTRDENASGEVVVQVVSAMSQSPPIPLAPDFAAQADLPAGGPETFGPMAIVVAAAGVGGVGLIGLVFFWVNEVRRYAFLRRLLQSGLGLALFSRIQGAKVLEHDTREEIHRLVAERPGIHYREILRALGLSNGRLAHHLQTLEREGLLRNERDGRLVRFFPARSTQRVGLLLSPRQTSILSHVRRSPGILQSELARVIGVSRQALHQQVGSLRDAGILLTSANGRSNALYLEAGLDTRIRTCRGCGTRYDRGPGTLDEVVCPGCGTT